MARSNASEPSVVLTCADLRFRLHHAMYALLITQRGIHSWPEE